MAYERSERKIIRILNYAYKHTYRYWNIYFYGRSRLVFSKGCWSKLNEQFGDLHEEQEAQQGKRGESKKKSEKESTKKKKKKEKKERLGLSTSEDKKECPVRVGGAEKRGKDKSWAEHTLSSAGRTIAALGRLDAAKGSERLEELRLEQEKKRHARI